MGGAPKEKVDSRTAAERVADARRDLRRLKRVVNVFQLAVAYAKRLALDETDPTETVYFDSRWPLFALKLIKFIVLCEEHPIRMSLLISQIEDAHQKANVNDICTSDMFQYLADDHQTPATHLVMWQNSS